MRYKKVKSIGVMKAAAKIGLKKLTWNMMRCVKLKSKADAVLQG
jgi:hypothetical protein